MLEAIDPVIGIDDHALAELTDLTTVHQPVYQHGPYPLRWTPDEIAAVPEHQETDRWVRPGGASTDEYKRDAVSLILDGSMPLI